MEARKLVDFPGGLELHIGVRPLHEAVLTPSERAPLLST